MQLDCVVVVVVRSGLAVLLRVVVATYEKLSSTVLRQRPSQELLGRLCHGRIDDNVLLVGRNQRCT